MANPTSSPRRRKPTGQLPILRRLPYPSHVPRDYNPYFPRVNEVRGGCAPQVAPFRLPPKAQPSPHRDGNKSTRQQRRVAGITLQSDLPEDEGVPQENAMVARDSSISRASELGPLRAGGPGTATGGARDELPRIAAAAWCVAALRDHLPGRQVGDRPRRGGSPQCPLPCLPRPDGPGPRRRPAGHRHTSPSS